MKATPNPGIERYRLDGPPGTNDGAFVIPYEAIELCVISSDGMGWDHVSVSTGQRCPRWAEMQFVKDLFFKPEEVVVQFHVGKEQHINMMPYCLHLWRQQGVTYQLPPRIMV